ncbi:hypothetical protein DEO72_LG11g2091 [Vigna unguiculata]|uniref:Uncharacterized protein n=1 Tax=Vigna unguiculata TaxID=3917 RepID=A0A4D6NMM1_VIGUN|nr:hypothetical protein DEO72_LG11g2091 [Vigna unguiculata]
MERYEEEVMRRSEKWKQVNRQFGKDKKYNTKPAVIPHYLIERSARVCPKVHLVQAQTQFRLHLVSSLVELQYPSSCRQGFC